MRGHIRRGLRGGKRTDAQGSELPAGLKPGSPAGSYGLSDIESINIYNGKLSAGVPLLRVGGRGGASYVITQPLHQIQWSFDHSLNTFDPGYGNYRWTWMSTQGSVNTEYDGLAPGYGPGVVHGKYAFRDLRPCGQNDPTYAETFTFVEFTAPDGTQHALYDEQSPYISHPCTEGTRIGRGYFFTMSQGGPTFQNYSDPPRSQ